MVDNVCPRCGKSKMNAEKVLNALSRRDNKTYICSDCGVSEAMFDRAKLTYLDMQNRWIIKPEELEEWKYTQK